MSYWEEFKKQYEPNSTLELTVTRKIPPSFLFFDFSNNIRGLLHVSELNWNFGLCQTDFRNIKVGSKLEVCIISFDDKYKTINLSRKSLPSIQKPSESIDWYNLVLQKETSATVFEEFRNKVIIQLESGLFGTVPLVGNKSWEVGSKLQVIPVRKISDQNIIECTIQELVSSAEAYSQEVIETFQKTKSENSFSTSENCLNSYNHLTDSIYWKYFNEEDKELFKNLFDSTENLFSNVLSGKDPVYIEFDFDLNIYRNYITNIAPALFNNQNQIIIYTEKELLAELSKLSFWYTQFDQVRKVEGTDQNINEKLFSLFNEKVLIRGTITKEGALKIRNIKEKVKEESLTEKQKVLRRNDVFFLNRPIVFSQFAPPNTNNQHFIQTIDNKILAFKRFNVAKTESLDILQKQGKEFKIFSHFLESQIEFDVKSANETEMQLKDCSLDIDIQSDGVTFSGKLSGKIELKHDDKIVISFRTEEGRQQSIGSGIVLSINNKIAKIKSNVENFDLVKTNCFIKKASSIKQYTIQLDILNQFFNNQLPLDTFYKVFHDRDSIEPPDNVIVEYENEFFKNKINPQTRAIDKAVGNKNILLIQGPPGTGKTTVITEIVKQLVKRGEKVLVTSQTHIAVDNVLEHIKEDEKLKIARVGQQDTASDFAADYLIEEARKRFSEEVQKIIDLKIEILQQIEQGKSITEISNYYSGNSLKIDWHNIQEFISLIIETDKQQISQINETLLNWREVISKTPKLLTNIFLKNLDVLFGTCIGIATNKEVSSSELIFNTVLLDEAGKANISETLTAISRAKKIILVGDHKQLPPYLDKKRVDYFKKFSKEVAEQKLTDLEIKHALGASFFEYLQKEGVLNEENKILLSEQYRMHPDIGNFISRSFYNSELSNGENTTKNFIPLPEPFNKQIIFIDTSSDKGSTESFIDDSYCNEVEAEFIIHKIIPELERNNISPKSYAILSPYSKQCEVLRKRLAEHYNNTFKSVEVATLDSFQGKEYDIVIFSFTRSAIRNKVGFLDDARRLNVAFSRAKKKLILIGNKETLTSPSSHYDKYYTDLFFNLWRYSSKYGKTYRINELDNRKLQNDFKLGQIVKAKVTRFEDYGVIVNLGSSPGLIFNSDLCEKKIIHPSDMLELKQEIEAKIIRIDSRGIRLSLKEVNEGTHHIHNSSDEQKFVRKKVNKFSLFNKEYKVSDIIEGTIIKIVQSSPTTLKVHIELKYGVYGSFYTFSENQRIKMKSKVLVEITKIDNIKQNVKCKIIA